MANLLMELVLQDWYLEQWMTSYSNSELRVKVALLPEQKF